MQEVYRQFIAGIQETSWIEFIAVITGIASVWFSRMENILLYPVGLVNTTIYIFISVKGHLFGEASVNLYYTLVSIYGWILWAKKNENQQHVLKITFSNRTDWISQSLFFATFYIAIFLCLSYLKKNFAPGAIPWADAFASATAYTGMWLMAKKKVESWYWWIATDLVSVPLYFVKGYVFTSVQFIVFTILAIWGLTEWIKKVKLATA